MRISDWSSDVCSSDLFDEPEPECALRHRHANPVIFRDIDRNGVSAGGRVDELHDGIAVRRLDGEEAANGFVHRPTDRKSTRLNSSHSCASRMQSSAGTTKQNKRRMNQQN